MSDNGNPGQRGSGAAPGAIDGAAGYFHLLTEVMQRVPHSRIEEIVEVLLRAYDEGRRIFLFGNGGSASLASHFACDLGKGTTAGTDHAKRFRAIALTDNIPMMTAWANDSHYEHIFSEQLKNQLEPGDLAFAISGSGNSPNVLRALETARAGGAYCVGLTGFRGGKMLALCNLCLVVPSDNMQVIEDIHLSTAHAIFTVLRNRLQGRLTARAASPKAALGMANK